MLTTLKKRIKSALGIRNFEVRQESPEYWNQLYKNGRWDYLQELNELAHYSVLVGYCQFYHAHGKILDVGCGTGLLQQRLSYLPYSKYTGIDLSDHAIEKAKCYADDRTEFFAADALTFNNNNKYDAIFFNESLYCFNECLPVLSHYQNLINDNGIFVISMHDTGISSFHWSEIERHYAILDSVNISNKKNVCWTIKAIQAKS